jgi:Cys-tRNA(Pro)/Cys-tRNA(Cys) deacylase
MQSTRALEFLTQANIPHEVCSFCAVERTLAEAAREIGMPLGSVFETLVVKGKRRRIMMVAVPGDRTLSLQKLARVTGEKRIDFVNADGVLRLTGYRKGEVSPLGSSGSYRLYVDSSSLQYERIAICAGQHGLRIVIAPEQLIRAVGATVADIVET